MIGSQVLVAVRVCISKDVTLIGTLVVVAVSAGAKRDVANIRCSIEIAIIRLIGDLDLIIDSVVVAIGEHIASIQQAVAIRVRPGAATGIIT